MRENGRYGTYLDKASTRREMILRQLTDNKCLWMDQCTLNLCITAFIAKNSHGSQAAGSGAQDSSNHDVPIDDPEPHELVQQPQQSLRTVRAKPTVANAHLALSDLKVQGDRKEQLGVAPSGTTSSGRRTA